jgi:hypothetical protein
VVNVGLQASLLYADLYFIQYMPRSGTGGLYGSSIFYFFWGASILISIMSGLIYIPTNSV